MKTSKESQPAEPGVAVVDDPEVEAPSIDLGQLTEEHTKMKALTPIPVSAQPVAMIEAALRSTTDVDLDRLERLWNLQKEYEAAQAEKAFNDAFAQWKSKPLKVERTEHVHYDSSKGPVDYWHEDLGIVINAVNETMGPFGLSVRWDFDIPEAGIAKPLRVGAILQHREGHSVDVWLPGLADTTGAKNDIQAMGSAIKYLQRSTLLAVTGLAPVSKLSEAWLAITEEEAQYIEAKLEADGADKAKFCAWIDIPSLRQMPRWKFARACARLGLKPVSPEAKTLQEEIDAEVGAA